MTTPETASPIDPLTMATVQARAVHEIARPIDEATTEAERAQAQMNAYITGTGKAQHHAAEMGAHLALISIAQDLRRIADHLTNTTTDTGHE